MATTISKTAQVLKYFAQQYGGPGIPCTRLVKMAYMSDLLAREYLGGPITDFRYYRYHFGPYDDAIVDVIEELVAADLAETKETYEGEEPTKRLCPRGAPIQFGFSAGEQEILRYVTANYLTMDLEELFIDVVYQTAPMLQTKNLKEVLPMASVDNRGTNAVGFSLEAVLRAEQEESFDDFVSPALA